MVDTRLFLNQMLRIVNIKEEVLAIIDVVADISYGWEIINDYVRLMQARIKKYAHPIEVDILSDPTSVLKLRATFLKLASILQLPLVRINQASSPDFYSVSEYYSGK